MLALGTLINVSTLSMQTLLAIYIYYFSAREYIISNDDDRVFPTRTIFGTFFFQYIFLFRYIFLRTFFSVQKHVIKIVTIKFVNLGV